MTQPTIRYGQDLLASLVADDVTGPIVVIASPSQKDHAKTIALPVQAVLDPVGLQRADLDALAGKTGGAKTIIGLGDEDAVAAAKYAAWKTDARLITLPAPLSGAGFCGRVEAMEDGRRRLAGEKTPALTLVDYGRVWDAGEDATRLAVGPVLALLTAVDDWRRASKAETLAFDEDLAMKAMETVSALLDRADDVFELSQGGIRAIAASLATVEELRGQSAGWAVAGSEHVLADCIEARLGRPLPRGALLCLTVVLMLEAQAKLSRPVKQFLYWIHAAWKPDQLNLPFRDLAEALAGLPDFGRDCAAPYSVIREVEFTPEKVASLLRAMNEPIIRNSFMDRTD